MKNLLPTLQAPGSAPRLAGALLSGLLVGATAATAGTPTTPPASTTDAQINVNITGTVRDAKGGAVPGASVVLKGTTTGTSTDAQGVFRINVPTGTETLVVSSVGFKKIEIAIGGRTTIDVTLDEETSSLNEVVVVGYGTQTKLSLTGSVAPVDMQKIQDLPVGSLSTAIAGQLPGVGVSGGTGRPGDAGQITVRNPQLLSKDGGTLRPLFVIDNVVRTEEDFNLLDASEVDAITILKDAAAAIYGARSSQGVVVVTTKRGKSGAPKFSYNTSVGVTDAVRLPSMMSGVDHARYLNTVNLTAGKPITDPLIYTPDELEYFSQNNYNWLQEAWKPSLLMRHALNVSGGSERATYFAGISYTGQDANFRNINSNKWTFRASTDVNVTKGLKLGLSLSGDLAQKRMYYLKQGGESPEKDMQSLLFTPQFNQPYVNGLPVLLSNASNVNTTDAFHFFEVQRSNNYTATRGTGLNLTANLDYELPWVKGLKVRGLFSKTMDNSFGKQYGTKYNVYRFSMLGQNKHIYGGDVLNAVSLNNGDRVRINPSYYDSYQLNGYVTYDRDFGKHHVSAIAFYEQSELHTDDVAAMAEGAIVGGLDNMRYATGVQTTSETEGENGLVSYAGRLNYSFANKYLLEFAIRRDGSTNFAPGYRWGTFPSLSVGWVISEEGFFRDNVQFVNMLKVRGSAAHMGNDATKPYQWQTNYATQTGRGFVAGNSDMGLVITPNSTMANPFVQWDDVNKFNAGLDMQFLENRLSFTGDAFFNHHYNMLTGLSSSVSQLVGATVPSENYAVVNAFGYEVSLGYNGQIGNDLNYRLNSFFTWNDSKNIKVDVDKGRVGTFLDPNGRSGDPGVLGYRYLGMFRNQEEVNAWRELYPNYTIFGEVPRPGMLYYEDLRGPKDPVTGQFTAPDGKITEDVDVEYLTKKANNHYSVGLNPSITYKGLSVGFTMGASFGGQAVLESTARSQATLTANRPAFWADHWAPDNQGAEYPNPYYKDNYNKTSSFWFRSSFQAGMRNANISYSFPSQLIGKAGISSLRVYFVAINPVNFYNPYDFKVYSGSYDAYPTLRSMSLGLNIGL
ncbi:SusC/RagA family TonB-linked outer membrane protein [Hymenobacter edaphi]|uniref:SusC/RagA family TonB-linked outer membrane protein n=1 Tax=Hymenobacter edaphi TaxID=2211146 RepID=A0A328BU35_9BACT|nr:TonB-dependent receptor [Hymenobacter edaphi]RAK70657.1 SusC/RagA family TonB-linked outer membrane protein [Hymenobacter edaphi]